MLAPEAQQHPVSRRSPVSGTRKTLDQRAIDTRPDPERNCTSDQRIKDKRGAAFGRSECENERGRGENSKEAARVGRGNEWVFVWIGKRILKLFV